METTNRPDSPLPWIVNLRHEVFTAKDFHGVANCRKDQDAAYIVHAANAYPVLVAALQALVKAEEAYGDETNVAVNHEWLRAREVLRDLGEL